MTDYYMGILVGAAIGYCVAVVTLFSMWSLCVIAGKESEREENKSL